MSEQNNLNYNGGIQIGLSGRYCVQVVDSTTDEIMADYGWHKNLILNNGMDAVASVEMGALSEIAISGTGSRPNYFTSSTSTITQSANYIGLVNSSSITSFNQSVTTNGTSSYPYIVQAGDLIIDQTLSQSVVITTSIDGKTIQISGNGQSFSTPRTFTIWKTSQYGLQGESQRTNNYYPGFVNTSSWNCGSVQSGSTLTMRRTFNFLPEVQTQSYTEVGCGWNTNPSYGAFSRVLLPQTVSLSPFQQLRLIYDLSVSYGPFTLITRSINIAGWPVGPSTNTLGTESVQNFNVSSVNIGGYSDGWGQYGLYTLDPSNISQFNVFASVYTASFYTGSPTSGSASNLPGDYTLTNTLGTYVPGTYTNTKTGFFTIYQVTSSNLMSIGFGTYLLDYNNNVLTYPWDKYGQAMVFSFNQPQSKNSYQSLTLTWRWYWSRIIQ